jgi:amino acid transporter
VALLFVGILYCTRSLQVVSSADTQGRVLGERYWVVTAMFELAVVLAMLTATELLSARDDIQDLSAPILMMVPLLVVLSLLRLRPRTTLWTALVAAIFHAGLSLWTFFRLGVPMSELPTLLSYAVLLVMIGVAGWLVASEFRAMMLDRVERKRATPTEPDDA